MKTRKNKFVFKKINGYNILFVNDHNHTVHIEAVVKSGFIHETKHTTGINHLLEHVLISSWKKCNGSCLSYWYNKGAILNASTNDTLMQYYIKGLATEVDEMVEYMSSIVTSAIFNKTIIENEKQAVIDELTSISENPKTTLYNVFYKTFFKDGLRYVEDIDLQIRNLKHLSIDDIKKAYHAFNHETLFFVVYGQYDRRHVMNLFSKHLKEINGRSFKETDCFSRVNKIIYTPFKLDGTNIIIGFPSSVMSEHFDCYTTLLHQLLFNEMRTKHKLLYDILITTKTNECGTNLMIEINVREYNVKETLHILVYLLKQYCSVEIDKTSVDACKKNVKYKYYTDFSNVDYYIKSILEKTPILTKKQLISQIDLFSPSMFKKMCNQLIVFDEALCVYQSKHNAHISWDMFI